MSNPFYVGIDEIVGAVVNELVGTEVPEDQLAALMSGDTELGYDDDEVSGDVDDIVGAAAPIVRRPPPRIVRPMPARPQGQINLAQLAALKAAGQRGVQQKGPEALKWELLPIPLTTIVAGATASIQVSPIRSQRLDQLEFPSSNVDHAWINIISIQILGVEQLNGTGGVRLSQLSESRANNILRGSTAQRSDNIIMVFQNMDTVNARTFYGTIGGPTIRVTG